MEIKSKYVKDTPLFRSVDLAYDSEEYVFAYHQSMADEAKAMVDYLYPYLVHLYDSKKLKKAFDATYIKEMNSFKYNLVTDEVEDIIAETSYDIMKNDTIIGSQGFIEFDLSAMSIEETNERPQASILGKMYSGQDSISTQHHAGKSRTPHTTDEDILEITPDELKELQHAMLLHTQQKHKVSERKQTLHIANLDTNTILQQIRNKKKKTHAATPPSQNHNNFTTQLSSDNNSDSSNEEDEEDNYHDTAEEVIRDNDDEEMADDTSSKYEYVNSDDSMTDDYNPTKHKNNASNHKQNSQSVTVGAEPPTLPREGGKG
jgi:coenzyme F420-reducing hydrogenase alpha subunit